MFKELASRNLAYPVGLSRYSQHFTIESLMVSGRKPLRLSEVARANPMLGTAQLPSFQLARTQSLFGGELLNVQSPSKSVAVQLDIGRSVIDGFKKLAEAVENASRYDLEKRWLTAHRQEYRGKWIALDGETLLATGSSSKEVFAAVSGHKPTPLVVEIAEHEASFPGW